MDESIANGTERRYYKSWVDRLDKGKTFKDFSLFRPKIITMWNTSSYASGPGLEAGVDKDTLEVSNDSISAPSTKSDHPKKLRKRVILAIAFGIGAIIAALIPVLLILYLPKAEPSEVVSKVDVQATVQNMKYTEELDNRDSLEYRNFTSQFCSEIEAVLQTSDLKDTYDGCLVTELRNGSIIVIFQVVFISKIIPTESKIKSSLLTASKETTDTGQILVPLGMFLLVESTVVLGIVTIIEAADNPVPKIAYGDTCRVTSSCKTDWAECSGQRCTCPSSRYISHQSDSCFLLGSILGGKCIQTCSVDNAECDDSQESVCVCSSGYYNRDGTCDSKIAIQDPCIETGPTDQCATYSAGCNNNKCSCEETHFYYQQNDTCLQLGSILGEACSDVCDDPNAVCDQEEGSLCVCNAEYFNKDGTCEQKIAIQDPCIETGPTDQCATYGAGCYNNKCSCEETHFYYQQNDTCLQQLAFQDTCIESGPNDQCATYGAECSNSKCRCTETHFYYQENNTCLVLGSILGEACIDVCDGPDAMCDQEEGQLCVCDVGYYNKDGTCEQKIAIQNLCIVTGPKDQCATHGAGCKSNKCSCEETHFYYQQNDTCIQLGSVLGEACSDVCYDPNSVCDQDQESICVCDVGYYDKDGTCEQKIAFQDSCVETGPFDQCATNGAECNNNKCNGAGCSNHICSCMDTHFHYQQTDICLQLGSVLEAECDPEKGCDVQDAVCVEGICKCEENFYDSNGECLQVTTPETTPTTATKTTTVLLTPATTSSLIRTSTAPSSVTSTSVESTSPTLSELLSKKTTPATSLMSTTTTLSSLASSTAVITSTSSETSTTTLTTTTTPSTSTLMTTKPTSSAATTTFSTIESTTTVLSSGPIEVSSSSTLRTTSESSAETSTTSLLTTTTPSTSTLMTTNPTSSAATTTSSTTESTTTVSSSAPILISSSSTLRTTSDASTKITKTTPATTLETKKITTALPTSSVTSTSPATIRSDLSTSVATSDSPKKSASTLSVTSSATTLSSKMTQSSLTSNTASTPSTSITTKIASTPLTTSSSTTKLTATSTFTSMSASTSSAIGLISTSKESPATSTTPKSSPSSSTSTTMSTPSTPVTTPASATQFSSATLSKTTTVLTTIKAPTSSQTKTEASTSTGITTSISSTVNAASTTATTITAHKSPTTDMRSMPSTTASPTKLSTAAATSTSPTSPSTTVSAQPTTTPNSPQTTTSGLLSEIHLFVPSSKKLEIGKVETIACAIDNIEHVAAVKLERTVGDETQLICSLTKTGIQFNTSYGDGHASHMTVDVNMLNSDKGANVTLTFDHVQCSDAATYRCSVTASDDSVDILAKAEHVDVFKPPLLDLNFPMELRKGTYGLNIGCVASLGYPKGDLTMQRKLPGESVFTLYVPEVEKAAELRWVETNDTTNACITNVRYDFDKSLEGWNMTEFRCAINAGTETEILSDIGVFEIVPKSVCGGKGNEEHVQHPFNCKLYVTCTVDTMTSNEIIWGYVKESSCSDDECWLPDDQCGTTQSPTTTSTTTTTTTTLPPGVPHIKCVLVSPLAKVGDSIRYSCNLQNVDKVTRIDIPELNFQEENNAGVSGIITVATDVTLNVSMSDGYEVGISFENVKCQQEGDITIKINNEATDTISVRIISEAEVPTLFVQENIYKNQKMVINCSGIVGRQEDGSPVATLEFQVKFSNANDFSTYTEGTEIANVSSDSCTNTETKQFTFYPNDQWTGAEVRCVTVDDTNERNYPSESVGPLTLLEPAIYFDAPSHIAVIGRMTSLACFVNNVPNGQSITVTRGTTNEPVITINTSGDVEKHISHFDAVDDVESPGTHVIRINFMSQCGDATKYFCESSGMIAATDIYVLSKPELTLSYEIVGGQDPWGDRASVCEGDLGSIEGSFVVEVFSSGSFVEYTDWWEGDIESTETDCGTYKKQKFYFYENTLGYLNKKQLRCAIKTMETLTEQELPVSEAKAVHVVPSNYCDDNSWEVYEHPFECHYYVNCKTGQAGSLRFQHCGTTKCPNRTLEICDVTSCDELCNRQFTTSTTTTTTTTLLPGVPHIKCVLRSPLPKVGDSIHYSCNLQNVDKVTRIDIPEINFQEENNAGVSGLFTLIDTGVTLNVSVSDGYEIGLSFENVKCQQEGDITIKINNEASDTISVRIISEAEVPTLSMQENIYTNQQTTINCSGIVGRQEDGSPVATLGLQVKFNNANDFSTYTDGTEVSNVSSDTCTYLETTQFIFYPTDHWSGAKVRCVAADDTDEVNYPSESVGPLTLLEPAIYFDAPSHIAVIDQMTSFACFANNVPNGEIITVTRGSTNEPVITINTSRDVEKHISYFDAVDDVDSSGLHVIRITFTSRCGDAAKYFCETSGMSTATDIYVLSKPELTLTYEIVQGQEPLADRPSLCEGYLGGIEGSFVVEVMSSGTFAEYTDWWEGDMESTETDCGTYKKQKFFFYETDLEFLEHKAIRCAIKVVDASTEQELPVSEAKIIRVTPSNYCDDNSWEFYEHPYDCHYFVSCNNGQAGNIHFQECWAGYCPNGTTCDASFCDGLCNRDFMVPTTTIPTTRGTDQYIDCYNTVKGEVGSDLTIHCVIGNSDNDYLTSIAVYKDESLFLEASGNAGTQGRADNTATLTFTPTTFSLKLLNLGCDQSTAYRFVVNSLLEDSVTVIANKEPVEPVITLPSLKTNQRATVKCDGNLGFPDSSKDMQIEKKMEGDSAFTVVVEGITETLEFNETECAFMKTIYFTFDATDEWENAELRCATNTENGILYSQLAPITALGAQEVFFIPVQPISEIGDSFSLTCTVSGVSDLTSIRISRGEPPEVVCSINDADVASPLDSITCTGELSSNTGSIQIDIGSVQCDDEGEYYCEPNDEASTSTRTSLTVTRAATSPTMSSEPKTLVENKLMLDAESFVCEAEVGYPTAGSIVLQTNRDGDFEKFVVPNFDRQASSDNCRTNETLTVKGVTFDASWNNTQLRCAVEDDEGTIMEIDSKEFTIHLVPENYCDGQDEYSTYPYDCHRYIRCVNGIVYVNSCLAQECPIFVNGTLSHCNSDRCLDLCP